MSPAWLWERHAPKSLQNGPSDAMRVSVPFAARVEAQPIPGGGTVPLYDDQGHSMLVPAPEADYWLGRGFSRTDGDPKQATADVTSALDTFRQSWIDFADATIEQSAVDRADNGKSHAQRDAWVALETAYREAVHVIETAYPPKA